MKIRSSLWNLENRIKHIEQRIANKPHIPISDTDVIFALPHETDIERLRVFLTSNSGFPIDGIVMVLRRNKGGFSAHAYKKDGMPYIPPSSHSRYVMEEIDYTILNIVEEEGSHKQSALYHGAPRNYRGQWLACVGFGYLAPIFILCYLCYKVTAGFVAFPLLAGSITLGCTLFSLGVTVFFWSNIGSSFDDTHITPVNEEYSE